MAKQKPVPGKEDGSKRSSNDSASPNPVPANTQPPPPPPPPPLPDRPLPPPIAHASDADFPEEAKKQIWAILNKGRGKKHKKSKKSDPNKPAENEEKGDDEAGGDIKEKSKSRLKFHSAAQTIPHGIPIIIGPIPSNGSLARPVPKNLNQRRKTDPTISGYVFVPEFASEVVNDPLEIHTWVQKKMKCLYIIWAFIIIMSCVLLGLIMFIFHIIPHILAYDILFRIFMGGRYNAGSVVGVMMSLVLISTWGCIMLTHPYPKYCVARISRWLICVVLHIYMSYNIITQILECRHLHRDLEIVLMDDLSLAINNNQTEVTRLEQFSQTYFECCGVYGMKDWKQIANRAIIPKSCCNERQFPGCYTERDHEMKEYWFDDCLKCEYAFLVIVAGFVLLIEILCLIVTFSSSLILRIVLKHTNQYDIDHVHPFT